MKWIATGMLALALVTSACGDDDDSGGGDGTTEQDQAAPSPERTAAIERLVTAFQQAGGTADQACVEAALEPYSDEVVVGLERALGSGNSDSETTAALAAMASCVNMG